MSRSRKDGRRRGGHVERNGLELWSRRCAKVNMWTPNRASKTITHRIERRQARRSIQREVAA